MTNKFEKGDRVYAINPRPEIEEDERGVITKIRDYGEHTVITVKIDKSPRLLAIEYHPEELAKEKEA